MPRPQHFPAVDQGAPQADNDVGVDDDHEYDNDDDYDDAKYNENGPNDEDDFDGDDSDGPSNEDELHGDNTNLLDDAETDAQDSDDDRDADVGTHDDVDSNKGAPDANDGLDVTTRCVVHFYLCCSTNRGLHTTCVVKCLI